MRDWPLYLIHLTVLVCQVIDIAVYTGPLYTWHSPALLISLVCFLIIVIVIIVDSYYRALILLQKQKLTKGTLVRAKNSLEFNLVPWNQQEKKWRYRKLRVVMGQWTVYSCRQRSQGQSRARHCGASGLPFRPVVDVFTSPWLGNNSHCWLHALLSEEENSHWRSFALLSEEDNSHWWLFALLSEEEKTSATAGYTPYLVKKKTVIGDRSPYSVKKKTVTGDRSPYLV